MTTKPCDAEKLTMCAHIERKRVGDERGRESGGGERD